MFGFFGMGFDKTDLLTRDSWVEISLALETLIASRVRIEFESVEILMFVIALNSDIGA